MAAPRSGPAFHFDVGSGRIFDRLELAAADLASGHGFRVLRFDPIEPVGPPGAWMLGGRFHPGFDAFTASAFRLSNTGILVCWAD